MRKRRQSESLPATEQVHPKSEDLDLCSIPELVSRLHREDRAAVEVVGRVLPAIAQAAEAAARALRAGGRIVYVGAGTSGRFGALDAAECPPTFGAHRGQVLAVVAGGAGAIARAVEGAEDDRAEGRRAIRALSVGDRDFVCGISASARTPFVLAALREARRRKAVTALVYCSSSPDLRHTADWTIFADTGPELVAGSTRLKAGTATKLILNAISTAAFVALGTVYRGRMVDLKLGSRKLRMRAERTVAELARVDARRAKQLLKDARGKVRLALAMHFTGLRPAAARRALEAHGLRGLEMLAGRS